MILVELDSVAVQWVGQETVPSATFKRKKNRRHYFFSDLSICKMPALRQLAYCQSCQ